MSPRPNECAICGTFFCQEHKDTPPARWWQNLIGWLIALGLAALIGFVAFFLITSGACDTCYDRAYKECQDKGWSDCDGWAASECIP